MNDQAATPDPALRKIRGLLDKAEATTFEAEQEALFAKAAELMARYRITEAMLDSTRPVVGRGKLVERDVNLGAGTYVRARLELLSTVGRTSCCEVLTSVGWDGRVGHIIGYETDVASVELLYTSLLVQGTAAMQREKTPAGQSAVKFRRAFLFAFARQVGERLHEANRVIQDQVQAESGSESVALVLADRRTKAKEETFRRYGKVRSLAGASPLASADGARAGRAAGATADINSGRNVSAPNTLSIGA